jgi:hypothetical protein
VNQWNFVLAAYGITAIATFLMVIVSWRAMRRAEAAADAVRRE